MATRALRLVFSTLILMPWAAFAQSATPAEPKVEFHVAPARGSVNLRAAPGADGRPGAVLARISRAEPAWRSTGSRSPKS
jgi:hypothetical protein